MKSAAFFLCTFLIACGGNQTSVSDDAGPACAPALCHHGTCKGTVCECETNWFGPQCNTHFDVAQFAVSKTVCSSEPARLTFSKKGDLKGFYVDIPKGAVNRCAIFVAGRSQASNLPTSKGVILTAYGLTVHAIDLELPILNGKLNLVPLNGTIDLFFLDKRATPLYLNTALNRFEPVQGYEFRKDGALVTTNHLSDFFLVDHKPDLIATARQRASKMVEFNVSKTTDENKNSLEMLTFRVSNEYRPFALERFDKTLGTFELSPMGGKQLFTVTVTDPNGNTAKKMINMDVDLCTGVQCSKAETCRYLDGKCAKIGDLCDPDPCWGHGVCKTDGINVECTCTPPFFGQVCYFKNPCVAGALDCNGRGTCNPLKAECDCSPGWYGKNCEVQDLCDAIVCQNAGKCDAGKCACDYGFHGDRCQFQNNCIEPSCLSAKNCEVAKCNNHGLCSKLSGACACEIEPGETKSKYIGAKCDQCASHRFQNYPSCDPILPCNLQCKNGSTCTYSGSKPVCACLPGYSGNLCETKDLCYGVTCPAHASCNPNDGKCSCSKGFLAPNCDKCSTGYVNYPFCFEDLCAKLKPCKNGGTCTMLQANFKCICSPGWIGDFCEKGDPCFGVTCPTNATCNGGKCLCNQGWLPPNCDKQDLCFNVSCPANQHCDTGKCSCNTGYAGANCNSCAPGYINYPNCTLDMCNPDPCNGHGTCKDGGCTCTGGWSGKYCSTPP